MSAATIGLARPRMELWDVGPELAAEWLVRNTFNRPISKSVVATYAADMASGRWRHPTGEALVFDSLGRLQQGQHRLRAIIESGATIQFWVNFGAHPDDFRVLDQGRRRSTADVLTMQGVTSARAAAAAARGALYLLHGRTEHWTGSAKYATPAAVESFHGDNVAVITRAVNEANVARRFAMAPPTQYAAVAIVVALASVENEQWSDFHAKVTDGLMLTDDSPITALRRWCIRRATSSSGGTTQQYNTAVITKAWNYFVEDRPTKLLKWSREEMPMPLPLSSRY